MRIPIFLFNGLLESGKTAFINEMLKKPVFADGNKTVVISGEEGIEEYDLQALEKRNISVVMVEEEDEFDEALMDRIYKEYKPQRVLIEYNGMWEVAKPFEMKWPKGWFLYQVMTLLNAETYNLYINNMRSIMISHFSCTDLVIINRMTEETNISGIRGAVKSINPTAKLFEADEAFNMQAIKDELPYDVKADIIDISKENYGIWYIDTWEKPELYNGKKVRVRGLFFQDPQDPKDCFSFGRFSMPCCADDIALMGLYCHNIGKPKCQNKDSIEIVAEIRYQKEEVYEGDKGPVLYVKSIEKASENQEELVVFS